MSLRHSMYRHRVRVASLEILTPPSSRGRGNVILGGHFVCQGVRRLKLDVKSRIAKRMQAVRGEAAFEMLGRATELERQGRSIIHLEIGEPDFDTPEPVVHAGIEWLKKGATHDSPIRGAWELRMAIARHLASGHPVEVEPERV